MKARLFLSALTALMIFPGVSQAKDASKPSTVHLGTDVPTAEQVKEGLYPDQMCEELKQTGFKCMGFKPALNFSLPATRFALGSSELSDALRVQLDVFATVLKERSATGPEIRIVGHADASGSEEVNNALSRQRAQAVKSYLIAQGVQPKLLVVHGDGARRLADPANPLGSVNRRVEIGRMGIQ